MKINQEVFDKTKLTEIEILKGVPGILLEYPNVPYCDNKVKDHILRYKIINDELEVDYIGIAAALENRAEIISRARKLRNELQSIITLNSKIPDKDSRLTGEQLDTVKKACNMFEKLKDEEYIRLKYEKYICLDEPEEPECDLPF